MDSILDIQARLVKLEKDIDERPEVVMSELSVCIEGIVRGIITEIIKLYPDTNVVANIRKIEESVGRGRKFYVNFGLGELLLLWKKAEIPELWNKLKHHLPAVFLSFPFDEFYEDRNPAIHHARVPKKTRVNRLYWSTLELLDTVLADECKGADPAVSQERPPERVIKDNLPRPDQVFIGRESQVTKILNWLKRDNRAWLVSITGVGGVGKSALAVEVARQCLGLSPLQEGVEPDAVSFDACVWTSAKEREFLAGAVHPRISVASTLDAIVNEVIRVAGATMDGGDKMAEASRVRQYEFALKLLRNRRILLVVDNMETIDDPQVLTFLTELPSPSKAIITDRRGVPQSNPIQLSEMSREEAMELLKNECAARNIKLTEEQAELLIFRTGGIPLVIVWALGLMSQSGLSPEAVFRRLADVRSSELLSFVFSYSFDRLTRNARRILWACALPGHPASGRQLADWADLGQADAEDALGELRMAALIRLYQAQDEATNILDRQFDVLPLTRDFVQSRSDFEQDGLRSRTAARIIRVIYDAEPNLDWPCIDTINKVERSKGLLTWAMEDAASRGDEALVLDGIRIAGYALGIRGYHAQRLALATLALKSAERLGDNAAAARCLVFHIAWVHFGWYDFDNCEQALREGLALSRISGDRCCEGSAIRLQGLVAKERAEVAKRQGCDQEAMALHEVARRHLKDALTIFEDIGDRYLQAITHGAIGSHFRDLDMLDEAETEMRMALEIARRLESAEEIHSIQCQKLSRLLSGNPNRLDEAEAYNREAMCLLERLKRPQGVAHCKLNFARIAEQKGELELALAYARDAEKLFLAVGAKQDVAYELSRLTALKNDIS